MMTQELFTIKILETYKIAQKNDWDKYTNRAWPETELIWLWKFYLEKHLKIFRNIC